MRRKVKEEGAQDEGKARASLIGLVGGRCKGERMWERAGPGLRGQVSIKSLNRV